MKLDRRTLLFSGAGALAIAGAGATTVGVKAHDTRTLLGWILRRNLGDSLVTDSAVDAFAQAYGPTFQAHHGFKHAVAWLADTVTPLDLGRIEAMERDVVTAFLLGSDFFLPDRRKTAPIQFLGLYDTTCGNPFKRT
jgi:hypothetical protein